MSYQGTHATETTFKSDGTDLVLAAGWKDHNGNLMLKSNDGGTLIVTQQQFDRLVRLIRRQ